jgi:hypothetical protein
MAHADVRQVNINDRKLVPNPFRYGLAMPMRRKSVTCQAHDR